MLIVKVDENGVELALKKLRKKTKNLFSLFKEKTYYVKKSVKRRNEILRAKYRMKKNMENNNA